MITSGRIIILTLPWPPSVNGYWRAVGSRVLICAAGRAYRRRVESAVIEALGWQAQPRLSDTRLAVGVVLHAPDGRRRDLDNSLKALLDAMAHAGIYADDSQIDRLTVSRGPVDKSGGGGFVEVEITQNQRSSHDPH